MIGWGGTWGGMMWYKQSIFEKRKNEKFKKRKKSILRRFKGIKIFRWYSWSFLVLDALRTHARPFKSNFMVVCMVVILVKGSFWVLGVGKI